MKEGLRASFALAVVLTIASLAAAPIAAQAAFPGENGKILFSRMSGGDLDIFMVKPDGTGLRNLTLHSQGDDDHPAVSPDGRSIAYSHVGTNYRLNQSHIIVKKLDGSIRSNLTPTSILENWGPSFSPNGKKITFVRSGNIFVMNAADGRSKRDLTSESKLVQTAIDPSYSPDGGSITFAGSVDDDFDIFVMNSDGSDLTDITFPGFLFHMDPEFSPDGESIVYSQGDPRDASGSIEDNDFDTYMMATDGSDRTIVPGATELDERYPVFSPDGEKVVFQSGSRSKIHVMDADGSDRVKITGGSHPTWGPAPGS